MKARTASQPNSRQITRLVRERIEQGGERLWRLEDFGNLPFMAVAQALSRLTKEGTLRRLSKGTYYRPRQTAFGQSRPNPTAIQELAARKKPLFPSGVAAASLLGFSTQTARYSEVATNASSLPRKLVGGDVVIHTRRPTAWSKLDKTEAAILDFLRRGGATSELPPEQTVERLLSLLSEKECFSRILRVAKTEPPRVRAILGALGEQLKAEPKALQVLRSSLNPLSRFDFGLFAILPNARAWQAKERRKL
jgi:hypothetical protein